ncbi:45420_t:CDS:2 [Gigaspora margarita]|uniref:45420_t:CDS:1 n=1 Tax=Gigaspora margarita TaxID=4874 RepID=A0ABN7UND7_GIGMA|nr:45420_t:CDS:2 [Gigaspora margarita]
MTILVVTVRYSSTDIEIVSCKICYPLPKVLPSSFRQFCNWQRTAYLVVVFSGKTLEYFQELEKHYSSPNSTTSRNIVVKLIFSIPYSTSPGNFGELIDLIQSRRNLPAISAETRHIAKNCLSEKTEKFEAQYKLVKQSDKEKEQDKNINLVTVESSEEEEVYVTRPQPYTKDRKGAKEDDLFYNPWSDDNPAAYLANSCEKDKILFNVNENLEKEQFSLAES